MEKIAASPEAAATMLCGGAGQLAYPEGAIGRSNRSGADWLRDESALSAVGRA